MLHPDWFDVVVGSNLFGDILSDLGPACTGTIGIAPSANINPEREFPSLFEPVHGSAPDIYGKGIANPIGQIWSGAMMLEHLGHPDAAKAIVDAIETILVEGPRTPDVGGNGEDGGYGQGDRRRDLEFHNRLAGAVIRLCVRVLLTASARSGLSSVDPVV